MDTPHDFLTEQEFLSLGATVDGFHTWLQDAIDKTIDRDSTEFFKLKEELWPEYCQELHDNLAFKPFWQAI